MNIKLEIIQPNTVPYLSYILYKKKEEESKFPLLLWVEINGRTDLDLQ